VVADHLVIATGGSSGERGVFVFDREALATFLGGLSRTLLQRLAAMGGPPPGGLPIAMVAAASPIHATGLAGRIAAPDAGLPFRFLSVPITLPLPEIVDRLNALQAPALYGYASILERLAAEQRAGRLAISPFVVTSTSETLTPEARAAITDAFGAPVVNTFGSSEGLVGASAPGDEIITFGSDMCIVEVLDDSVLVTNLFNFTQPLIRYELNDVFVRRDDAPDHGHLRAVVEGRADDVLHYEGDVHVHPGVVRSVLLHVPEVVDYRVLQTRRGIDVEAIVTAAVDVADLRARLGDALGGAGLAAAEVGVRFVDDVGRHRDTGKLRRFVPLA
jgi:phenylacetate-coenzyme A ligase PaaK-like adenylate-forming protein